jgi:D-glycero-alpha-D-manno-heptose-7-phosphate kinase
MVLYYTGRSRSSAAIISEQQKNTSSGNATAIEAMHRIKQSSKDMKFALLKGDMAEFGRILGQAWEDKKKMAGAITNPVIQEAFDTALGAGAVAGKVSGAGGGGFMMLMVPPARKMAVVQALSRLPGQVMPFQFTERGAHAWRVYETDKVPEVWKR